jgi:hypothetical protein
MNSSSPFKSTGEGIIDMSVSELEASWTSPLPFD